MRERQMSERPKSSTTFPLSPFIEEVGGDVFIIFFGEICIYKRVRVSRCYKWALNIMS
jgi:hypothetical protein